MLGSLLAGIIGCAGVGSVGGSANAGGGTSVPSLGPAVIFFSDLDSGTNLGGENGNGVYVTVYGANFGSSQQGNMVKIGGTAAVNYKVWTNKQVAFQVPSGVPLGSQSISVVVGGAASNSVPFTVRAQGKVYCVSPTGSNSDTGVFGHCWRNVQHAVDVIQPGDVVYIREGIVEARSDEADGSVAVGLNRSLTGTAGNPIALVGYPGETAQIGQIGSGPCSSSQCFEGVATYDNNSLYSYFTIANLVLRGNNYALVATANYLQAAPRSHNWRIVGNDISCPFGDGATACVETSQVDNVSFYGNNVHDVGWTGASTLYHGVYFSTDSNHIDAGWNTIAHVNGGSGMQFHSSPLNGGGSGDPTGHQQFDLHVHDNIVSDVQNSGLLLATVDPSQGPVEVFNNIVYHVGRGPSQNGQGGYFCVDFPGYVNAPPAGGGVAEVYNNTLYDCGPQTAQGQLGPGWGGAFDSSGPQNGQPNLQVRIRNNIVYQPTAGEYYWALFDTAGDCAATCNNINGTNNLFFGLGAPPANPNVSGSLNVDPEFVSPASSDFHLQSSSPARAAGVSTGLTINLEGQPLGAPPDLGVY